MSHPPGLPDLFIDRSLGRIQVPAILRAAKLRLTTLAEEYGVPNDETVLDVTWIRDSATAGRVALMKDEEIARNPAEKATVQTERARCFCLARKDLPAAEMAGWFLAALPDLVHVCGSVPAPFIFSVERGRVHQIL